MATPAPNLETSRMLEPFTEDIPPMYFLSALYQTPPRNFHNSTDIVIDVERRKPEIALPVPKVENGPRMNKTGAYTSKKQPPPLLYEGLPLTAEELKKRVPGQSPYEDTNRGAAKRRIIQSGFRQLGEKVRRTSELMCAQVLQSGKIEIPDPQGTEDLFELDYQPNPAHFAPVDIPWTDHDNSKPLLDIDRRARLIRNNGHILCNTLIFGNGSYENFIRNAEVKELLDNRRMNFGEIEVRRKFQGGHYEGYIQVGTRRFHMWLYEGYYQDPITGEIREYVDENSVIMLRHNMLRTAASGSEEEENDRGVDSRLDLTFGSIDLVRAPDAAALAEIGLDLSMDGNVPRFSSPERGLDLSVNAYYGQDNGSFVATVGSRPLPIPTGIDTFGNLRTYPGDSV